MKNRNIKHSDHWLTPRIFFDKLNEKYNFNLDPCPAYHDIREWDGLKIDWDSRNFINPPYSQKSKEAFVIKAIHESKKGKLCVMLLPVSTSTKLFHEIILPEKPKVKFIKGRLPFIGQNEKGQIVNSEKPTQELIEWTDEEGEITLISKHVKNSGQHDSMLVVFDGRSASDKAKFLIDRFIKRDVRGWIVAIQNKQGKLF